MPPVQGAPGAVDLRDSSDGTLEGTCELRECRYDDGKVPRAGISLTTVLRIPLHKTGS